jgi:hypothetical protein
MGTKFSLIGCTLGGPIRLGSDSADTSIENVNFTAREWNYHIHYAEIWCTRSAEHWSREKAITRAKDEVLAALAERKKAEQRQMSIDDYIKTWKGKTVLLLGDYDDSGMARLEVIRNCLDGFGYNTLLVKELPDVLHYDIPQKVVMLAGLSRFVIVDDSSKSGHLTEIELCKLNRWVTILLRAEGQHGSWMTAGASAFSKVILEKSYSLDKPGPALAEATEWAESMLKELQTTLDNTYPWRKKID